MLPPEIPARRNLPISQENMEEVEYLRLENWYNRFSDEPGDYHPEAHWLFACHAAFPLLLTPELLYKLWLNFRTFPNKSGKTRYIPYMVISDLLLSDLVKEVSTGMYEMAPGIRFALLQYLQQTEQTGGKKRLQEVADFVSVWVKECLTGTDQKTRAFREAQEWAIEVYLNPESAIRQIYDELQKAYEKQDAHAQLRLNTKLENLNKQYKFRIQLNPEADYVSRLEHLLNYSQGTKNLLYDRTEAAITAFSRIPEPDLKKSATGTAPGGLLTIPREVGGKLRREKQGPSHDGEQIYALLVGIDEYANSQISRLSGCASDARDIADYLRKYHGEKDLRILTLANQEATYQNIVQNFREHFRLAGAEDVILFYFAGHADLSFTYPEDIASQFPADKEPGLICYDALPGEVKNTLFNRELTNLLTAAAERNPHTVIIMDTHYGHRISHSPQNPISHVVLAATQDDTEYARETRINNKSRGLFTWALLDVLEKNQGNISYADLIAQTQAQVKNQGNDQNPALIPYHSFDTSQGFLGKTISPKDEGQQARLFALIVGINRYPTLPPLAGCVNDAVAVHDFLQSRVDATQTLLAMTLLLDEQATRASVITQFENITAAIEKNDTVVFYFAGYGSQEPAPAAFRAEETDSLNETIVFYDSRLSEGMDLADKEIAVLLDRIAVKGAHILTISDCSHRDNADAITGENCRVAPRFPRIRPLSSYILPDTDQPSPAHFALTATSGDESAKEVFSEGQVRGIMTTSLLDILRSSGGNMSYRDMITRLKTRIAQRTFDQVPALVSTLDLQTDFLNGLIQSGVSNIQLKFDPQQSHWVINRGTSHGFRGEGIGGEKMILAVYPQNTLLDNNFSTPLAEASVDLPKADRSFVFVGNISLDPKEIYQAKVISMPVAPVKIYFGGENPKGVEIIRKTFLNSSQAIYLEEVPEPQLADYHIISDEQQYLILRPADRRERPLVRPSEYISDESAAEVVRQINHIARWRQILEMVNPGNVLPGESIRLEIYPEASEIPDNSGVLVYPAWSQGISFRVRLVNTTSRRLYCALVYMAGSFEINTSLLGKNGGIWIEPEGEAWALEGNPLRAVVNEELQRAGLRESQEIFKLIFAGGEFIVEGLNQASIYELQYLTRSLGETSTRNLLFNGNSTYFDWNTFEIPFIIRVEEEATGSEMA
ncbi:MAG: caspase family protein [Bacteroidia bacterium]|nr:caspase family protein [Bacteroidia bacterium]